MTKKIAAFILCLLLIMVPVTFAQGGETEIEALNALNIGKFSDAEKVVTRGEFAGAVSDVLNYDMRPEPQNGNFTDVVKDYEYSGAIYDANKRGLISGFGDGAFGINQPIRYEHAIKILVSALGYDTLAKVRGGYPTGYMVIAAEQRIIRGVTKGAGDTLTAGEAAKLIVNAMNTPVLQQVIFGGEAPGYEAYEDETLLYHYAGIRKISGILSDNGITSLSGNTATKRGNVIIDGKVYDSSDVFSEELIGRKVVAYSKEFSEDDAKLLYISTEDNVKLFEITAEKLITNDGDFSVRNIVYEDVYGNITAAKVDGAADVIYNGKAHLNLSASDLKLALGKILLIDNNFDNVYDCLIIEDREVFSVAGISAENVIIYKKSGTPLKLENVKNLFVSRDGTQCTLSDIKEWDTVSAEISVDKSTVTISASSKKISGMVNGIEYTTKTVLIDKTYYRAINDEVLDRIDVSGSYEFCLDIEGNIANIKTELSSDKYVGVLVNAIEGSGVSKGVLVRIFTTLGNFDDLSLSDRVIIDGNSNMTDSQALSYIKNNMTGKLVSCKKDSKGNLTEINLPYNGTPAAHQEKDSFRVDYADSDKVITCYVGGGVRNFGGQVLAKTDATKVFIIPSDITEYQNYAVVKASYFKHCTNYNILAYSIGAENGCSEYIINIGKGVEEYTSDHRPMVITKVSSVLNDSDEVVSAVSGIASGADVKYFEKTPGMISAAGIKKGDVVRYQLDTENRIVDIVRLVDGTNVKILREENPASYGASPRFSLYDVYYRFDNILGLTKTDLSKGFKEEVVEAGLLRQSISTGYIYTVDTKRDNEVAKATYNDINAYKEVAAERSRVFVYSYSGSESLIVIYN